MDRLFLLFSLMLAANLVMAVLGQQCASSSVNPVGQCGCEGQVFVGEGDCRFFFVCTADNDDYAEGEEYDPGRNDGCYFECSGEGKKRCPLFQGHTVRSARGAG